MVFISLLFDRYLEYINFIILAHCKIFLLLLHKNLNNIINFIRENKHF